MPSTLPPSILQQCSETLAAEIQQVRHIGGGDINQTRLLKTSNGNYFIKINDVPFAAEMFEKEAKGLTLLAETKTIRIPEVIAHGQTDDGAFLLLEYIETGYRQDGFWEEFGRSLADLHRCTAPHFGLDHSNYIGSLQQPNGMHSSFVEFYINERLQPQLDMAISSKRLNTSDGKHFEKLYKKLPDLCPNEPPALIHGDLWSGNFLVCSISQPVLFDPSVAYSHRELDLAMSRLFGGFDRSFYRSYEEAYPMASGFEKRLLVYQLYYLMVHVNLFGGGYVGSVRRILEELA